jgi:CheY-like chemotaxis protein
LGAAVHTMSQTETLSGARHQARRGEGLQHRVLVVDDEPMLRLMAMTLLEELGCLVQEAASGEEALAMIEERPGRFTHLLTDIQMPGRLDGFRLAQLVSTLYPAIRIVMTSADASWAEEVAEQDLAFLAKPWRDGELRAAFRR